MGIPGFGSNPKDVAKEVAREAVTEKSYPGTENRSKISALQNEIAEAQLKLQQAESTMMELQKRLSEYQNRERQIAEVMIMAQISAQRVEAEARSRAEVLIQETDEELRRKNQELELLRLKSLQFKKELYDRLDQYRTSLDQMGEISEDVTFTPTLISREKKPGKVAGA
jgi:hypothetical protein